MRPQVQALFGEFLPNPSPRFRGVQPSPSRISLRRIRTQRLPKMVAGWPQIAQDGLQDGPILRNAFSNVPGRPRDVSKWLRNSPRKPRH
eukprot:3356354-Pyramimonas_sp.AAC.2